MKVREISCGKMHELTIALDKAGFDSELIQKIINSENNKMAESMYVSIVEKKTEPTEKFTLFADLGIIMVPEDYVHEKQLGLFEKKNRKKFYFYNDAITDTNFSNPTRILKPGDKLWVRAFKQVISGNTTSEDRMGFLKKMNAIHTGAQGASLVWEQKRDLLPKGYWYCSFDEKDRLWKDADGNHRVPFVNAHSDGDFKLDLGSFENDWHGHSVILVFCNLPASEQAST